MQLTAAVGDLGTSELQERLTTYRQHFNNRLESYAYNTRRDVSKFEAVQQEYDIRMERGRKNRNKYDVYNLAGKIRCNLKPYSLMTIQRENRNAYYVVQGVDKSQLTYFAMNPKEWHTIVEANDEGWIRVDPRLISRVEEIIASNHKKIVPLYELKPQQRLGYLKDISTIECLKTSGDGEYVQGEHYPIVVQTNVTESFEKQRPTVGKDGEVRLKDFVTVRKLLNIRIGKKRFSEVKDDIEFIVEHFDVPNPGTVSERYPEEYKAMVEVMTKLESGRAWKFKPFQKEDMARLMVKGDGLLAWEQGLGKTLAGLSFFKAHEALGNVKTGLVIAPQDLIPQWRAEAKKFYGLDIPWLKTYEDFRNCRDHIKAGGTGLYITHFEALSRTGKVDGKRNMLPMDMKVKHHLHTEPAYRTWEEDAGDGQPGYVTHPAKQQFVDVLATHACPGCGSNYRQGWNPEKGFCSNCRWMHVEKKVKPLYNVIKNTFREGLLIIDELTMIKGESDRSRALRGIKSRYVLGMTGTPVKNYIPDAFWGLWKCLGNATPRFPFDYAGGKTQFENNFAVVEFETTGYKRRGRKVLPEVTNVSALWRLLSSAIVRRRKEETGEKLVPRTFYEVTVPWGSQQRQQYKQWLYRFGEFFANENPDHPVVKAGAQDRMAAMLGQLHKLEFATTMPEVDYDRDYFGQEVSNWTPKNAKVLEIAMHHAAKGEKVLIGSSVKQLGRFLTQELNAREVKTVNILKDGEGAQDTKSPAQRAKVVKQFQEGDAKVMVASIQAMSLGHNLDKASVVIITGLPWDYASLDQFVARVHRLTSKKDVRVYVCLTEGSIDQKKWELLVRKGAAAQLALDGRLIEEDEKQIDKTAFLKDLKDAGVTVGADSAVSEDVVREIWEKITKPSDLGELNLEPSGDLSDLAESIDDKAVPNGNQYDSPIGPERNPDAEADLEEVVEEEEEQTETRYLVITGRGTAAAIHSYLYSFAERAANARVRGRTSSRSDRVPRRITTTGSTRVGGSSRAATASATTRIATDAIDKYTEEEEYADSKQAVEEEPITISEVVEMIENGEVEEDENGDLVEVAASSRRRWTTRSSSRKSPSRLPPKSSSSASKNPPTSDRGAICLPVAGRIGVVIESDSEVVLVRDLAPLVRAEVEKRKRVWENEWRGSACDHNPIGPVERIEFESGVPMRAIYRVTSEESIHVDVDVADRLLMAVDRHIWEVPVYKKSEVRAQINAEAKAVRDRIIAEGGQITKSSVPAMRRRIYKERTA